MKKVNSFPHVTLNINGLTCIRGGRQIVADLSFSHQSGQFLQILGINGVGKSSLLAVIAGLLPFEGKLEFTAPQIDLSETDITQHMLFLSHLNAIHPDLNLIENLTFWSHVTDGEDDLINVALASAKLSHLSHVRAGALSKGQQRRLAIARLLVTQKPIWILDEPTSALDKQGDNWVAGLISAHVKNNGFCIAATHRPINLEPDVPVETLELTPITQPIYDTDVAGAY